MTSMIHEVHSIGQTIRYCLRDKLVLNAEGQKQPVFRDRAELLHFNQCFGNIPALIQQFQEVTRLNKNVLNPFYHIAFTVAPGEKLSKSKWIELSMDCARKLDFENKQFLTILHKDSAVQHIHIVANRIGFDGSLANESFTKYKLSNLCIDTALRYDLAPTQDPRQKIPFEEKQRLRKDIRLERLKEHLEKILRSCSDLPSLTTQLEKEHIKVFKNERGISFMLDQRAIFKGSEAGYPWRKIEAILKQNQQLQLHQQQEHLSPDQQIREQQTIDEPETPRLRHRISHHL